MCVGVDANAFECPSGRVCNMHVQNCVHGVSLLAGVLVVVYQHSTPLW